MGHTVTLKDIQDVQRVLLAASSDARTRRHKDIFMYIIPGSLVSYEVTYQGDVLYNGEDINTAIDTFNNVTGV